MAMITKVKKIGSDKINEKVLGTRTSAGYDPAYDTSLEHDYESGNLVLKITLRMFLKKVEPDAVTAAAFKVIAASKGITVPAGTTPGGYQDYDKNTKIIGDWPSASWAAFQQNVALQANLWDGKFWLIPPDNFNHFDRSEGSWTNESGEVTVRPNIKCAFNLEFAAHHSYAHVVIDAVNLLDTYFRADSATYTSQNGVPVHHNKRDMNNVPIPTVHPVIAHEVGHAIGQPHIGRLRDLALCNFAIAMREMLPKGSSAGIFVGGLAGLDGGHGSDVCYGAGATAGDINNIMGAGNVFASENAKPWLDRILHHLNLDVQDSTMAWAGLHAWKVSRSEVKPKVWEKHKPTRASDSDLGPIGVKITQRDTTVLKEFELDGNILFAVAKADIRPEAEGFMHLVGSSVVQFQDHVIKFCGHTDSTGSRAMNQNLSLRRAEAVMNWFRAKNYVKVNKSLAEGYGETQLKVVENTSADRAKNRRVVVKVYAK